MREFFITHLYFIPVFAWVAAVVVKWAIIAHKKQFVVRHMFGSGGMPSVHAALVTSLTTAIGIKYSIYDDLFLVCVAFSCIIIYDALNVRFEAGRHAKALNLMSKKEVKEFNESIGHLPKEALVGSIIGILTAIVTLGF